MAISAEFTADFSQFQQGVKDAVGAAEELGRAFVDFGREVVDASKQFIDSYAEEEAATQRMVTALQNQGTATDATVQKYKDLASQFQQTTTYADDAITSVEAVLTQVGNVLPEDMEAALKATTDLAAGLNIDLPSAAQMMAKAIGSGGESLGKLKVVLGDVNLKGAETKDVIAAVSEKFGGQAAAATETLNGKLAQTANKFDDVKGKIGEVLSQALGPIIDAFLSLPEGLQVAIGGFALLVTALTPVAIAFGAVVSAVGTLATALGITLAGSIATLSALFLPGAALLAGIAAVYLAFKHWDAITGFVKGVYEGVKTWLVDKFTAIVGWVQEKVGAITGFFKDMYQKVVGGSYVPDMMQGIAEEFRSLGGVMVEPARAATKAVAQSFQMLMSDPNVAGFFGSGPQGAVASTLYGGGGRFTPEEAAALASGQFINFAGSGIATGRAGFGAPMNNVFHVNGTAEDTARQIADILARQVRSGARFGGA